MSISQDDPSCTKGYRLIIALLYISVLFLDRMDVTIVNVAMPTFAHIFHVRLTETEWISTGFLLALALVILLSAWLGDKFGLKTMFITSVSIFTISSCLCALSWNIESLIIFRILQGIGGGIIVPIGMAMTYRVYTKREYAKLASYTLMPTLIAPAIAPAIGGFFIEHLSWHWIFLINLPIGIIAIIISIVYIKEIKVPNATSFDYLGGILSATFLISLFLFLSRLGRYSFTDPKVSLYVIIFIISFILFVIQELKTKKPLINMKLFKIPLFTQGNIIQVLLQVCYYGSMFLIALYFQTGLGMSPLLSGLAMSPQPIGTIVMLAISAKMYNKYGPKLNMFIGMIGIAITSYAIITIQTKDQIIWACSLLFIRGLLIGCVNSAAHALTMHDIQKDKTAQASAIFSTARQIGISLGVAISAMILATGFRTLHISLNTSIIIAHPNAIPVFKMAFIMMTIIALLCAIIAMTINNKKILNDLKKHSC